jgi:hypothetical protein
MDRTRRCTASTGTSQAASAFKRFAESRPAAKSFGLLGTYDGNEIASVLL